MSRLLFYFIHLKSTTLPYLYVAGKERQYQAVENILNVKIDSNMKLDL